MIYKFKSATLISEEGSIIPVSDTDKSAFSAEAALARGLLKDTPKNESTKIERFELYMRLKAGETTFSAADVALLRESALQFPTLIAGQLCRILDQKQPEVAAVAAAG